MNELWQSKKAKVTVGGFSLIPAVTTILTILLAHYLPEWMSPEEKTELVKATVQVVAFGLSFLLAGYNVGQGLADFGKERS